MNLILDQSRDNYRYCPGEEHIIISNAICRGRRRVNFPKCRGCQFNDDERRTNPKTRTGAPSLAQQGWGTDARPADPNDAMHKVFKAYDVRGLVPDPLSTDVAWRIGHAAAQFLRTKITGMAMTQPNARSIVVGRDIRTHSPALQAAFIEGARSTGMDVINIGLIDTPQIYFAVNHLNACGGVQTTASHNPAPYNGFKICAARGRPVGAGTGLESIREIAARVPRHETATAGRLSEADLTKPYKDFVRGFLHDTPAIARPLTVVVDASNGCAGRWFDILFGDVPGLTIIPLNFQHDGSFVHEPNPMVDAHLADLCDTVLKQKADFGVCFDGDADRCVFVDHRSNIVRSDHLTALLARVFLEKQPGEAVVYDLRSSRVVREEIERAGGVPIRQRVGHAFMKKALAENNGVFGGELSGHFYFRDNWYCDSGMLVFVHIVNLLADSGRNLAEWIKPLKRLQTSGEINFENPDADAAIAKVLEKYHDGECDTLDGVTVQYPAWWFNIRKSNTEPLLRLNLEARTKQLLQQKLAELTPLLGRRVDH